VAKRIYAVKLKGRNGGTSLVEASSQEAAVRKATESLVEKVYIPTPLETLRLQQEGAKLLTESVGPAEPNTDESGGTESQSENEAGADAGTGSAG